MIQVQNNNVQKIQEVPQRPVTNNLPHGGYHMPRSVTFLLSRLSIGVISVLVL